MFRRGKRARGGGPRRSDFNGPSASNARQMGSVQGLCQMLLGLHGGYNRYASLVGSNWNHELYGLYIDYVQPDPHAPPSRMRVVVPTVIHGIPLELFESPIRNVALTDHLTRVVCVFLGKVSGPFQNQNPNGKLSIYKPSQNVLRRSCALIDDYYLEIRLTASLPQKHGRQVDGEKAAEMIRSITELVSRCLMFKNMDEIAVHKHICSVEDQAFLRNSLSKHNLVAFVANGSILPRLTGSDDRPLEAGEAVAFVSPKSLEVTLEVPNGKSVTGMGIPEGITLIVGGAFHGKTTLLHALQFGIYNKVPGDGREFVVSDPSSVKIRAENGRPVTNVNISPFIRQLPCGKDTKTFSSTCSSGSTSQAANIMESLFNGSKCLLIDEDTCASNFMIRDSIMKQLVPDDEEPIMSFYSKIEAVKRDWETSIILVLGGSGIFFSVADLVIQMKEYMPHDVTAPAKAICLKRDQDPTSVIVEDHRPLGQALPRKVTARGLNTIQYDDMNIDLSCVEQLVEVGQTYLISDILKDHLRLEFSNFKLSEFVRYVEDCHKGGFSTNDNALDVFGIYKNGFSAECRRFEIAAAVNRSPMTT